MRIWHPKKLPPCHDNGHLQSASDAHAYRSRFRQNPFAKAGSILMPTVLRFGAAAGRRRCCCEEDEPIICTGCDTDTAPSKMQVEVWGLINNNCSTCDEINDTFILDYDDSYATCSWTYSFVGACCTWTLGVQSGPVLFIWDAKSGDLQLLQYERMDINPSSDCSSYDDVLMGAPWPVGDWWCKGDPNVGIRASVTSL